MKHMTLRELRDLIDYITKDVPEPYLSQMLDGPVWAKSANASGVEIGCLMAERRTHESSRVDDIDSATLCTLSWPKKVSE